MALIRVVLADDHVLVRSAFRTLIERLDGVKVVAEASDGHELLQHVDAHGPDLVVTDIEMPGMDGVAATAAIRERHPAMPVLMVSMHATEDHVRRALAAGASGFLMKTASPRELECAVRGLVDDPLQPQVHVALADMPTGLTARQLEILKMIALGKGSMEIGLALGISPKTVDVHRGRIQARLQLHNIASLTLFAIRHGLIKP